MSTPNIRLENLAEVKAFAELCKLDPSILLKPEFSFVKSLIEHFGGKVDLPATKETESDSEVESEESDLELDMTGVIEPDTDKPQEMGNPTSQPTEEEIAESQAKRSEAVSAFVEKDYEKALQLYTEAIILNPQAALLYAKRGQIYLLSNKPNACIRDCNRALELNPDSAAGHKFRGRAYHLLGKWEEAANDLRLACKFDFDEQADEWLREATPNARKIEERKRKKERKLEEKLGRAKGENVREEKEKEKEKEKEEEEDIKLNPEERGSFYKLLSDPEMLDGFMDPEIFTAFKEINENPSALWKYHKNPKVVAFIEKVAKKFDDEAGRPNLSDMMAGMSSFPGLNDQLFKQPKPTNQPQPRDDDDDVGLD